MHTAPATTHDLHTAAPNAAGPQGLADLALEPTPAELADFEARMASLVGLTDEKIADRIGIPASLVPQFRQLMAVETVR